MAACETIASVLQIRSGWDGSPLASHAVVRYECAAAFCMKVSASSAPSGRAK